MATQKGRNRRNKRAKPYKLFRKLPDTQEAFDKY